MNAGQRVPQHSAGPARIRGIHYSKPILSE